MSEMGFYSPGESYLHRSHPAAKIVVFAIAVTLLPLIVQHWYSNLIVAMALGGIVWSARVGRKQLLYFSPALGLIIIAAVSWLFTDLGGTPIVALEFGGFQYTLRDRTVHQSVNMSSRALVWVLSYVVLLTTTSSRDMMTGLESLGLPHRASTAVGMTLKFWANVIADTRNVMDAQRVRGVDFDHGPKLRSLKQRFIVATVPTIFLMLKRFRTLSFALSLRAFGAPGSKTRLYAPPFTMQDFKLVAVILSMLISFIVIDRLVFP